MLLLRFFGWAILAHITTFRQQTIWTFFSTLFLLPYWIVSSFWNLTIRDEKEMVREGILAVNQGWRNEGTCKPPEWVMEGFLALGRLT